MLHAGVCVVVTNYYRLFSGVTSAWIGGKLQNGNWIWTTSGKEISYTDWHNGQPYNGGPDAGILLRTDMSPGHWDDKDPTQNHAFVCERHY